jgi:threonine/homoserine/homoserine lactone efflux protein
VTDLFQFLPAVVMLLLVPGPTNTVMATAGAGPRQSPLLLLAAELAGYATIITLATVLLVPLVAAWPPAGVIVKLVVSAYLIGIAIKLWRGRVAIEASGTAVVGPGLVYLTTALNPKGLIFAMAVFPHAHPQLWMYAALFSVCVIACGYGWFSLGRGLALMSGRRATLIPRVASVAILVFAALLARSVVS